ncbi:hypothetical protein [Nannocystis punicea]|uniref:Lipoprotein n=1 Tax=Nannocystis punicea TaxID=2995304 RepID=A0ABY7H8T5_9BACT|nr:hypothetical protein [Nannocystis poenicansa]WAS95677.1 hypothetical protein O0S08_05900 [Nannocystis poenicansa]
MPHPALAYRTALVVALFALAGCSRGCSLEPADPCDEDGDCDAPETCLRGYCRSPHFVALDRECRAAPDCREKGNCGALIVRSFLGADNSLECGAVDEADCRAAQVCATYGKCSMYDGFCVAAKDEDCVASQRCGSHEECSVDSFECVRRWPECSRFSPPPGAPGWYQAAEAAVVVDMQRMGGPWQPGAVESAVIACEARLAQGGWSRVRLAGRCKDGPGFRSEPATFLLSGVRLAPGDELAVAVQANNERGRASSDSFVKAKYTGASPFQGGAGEETLICHVVAREVARSLVADALTRAGEELSGVRAIRPRSFGPPPLERAREAIGEAAVWMGWTDPEVGALLQQTTEVEQAWRQHLVAWLTALREQATPPGAAARAEKLAIQATAHVCGERLAALRKGARPTEASACGLELTVTNRGKAAETFAPRFFEMEWLSVVGGVAERVEVEPIGGVRVVELPARGTAKFVLTGKEKDLPLATSAPGDFTLLHGRVTFFSEITLRAEPAADRPSGKKAKQTKRK